LLRLQGEPMLSSTFMGFGRISSVFLYVFDDQAEEARESEGRSAIRKLNNNRRILSCGNKRH